MQNLSSNTYKSDFVSTFDGDDSGDLKPRQTPGVLYSAANPTPVRAPKLLAWSGSLAESLGIAAPADEADINILAGNAVTPTMRPYAACYAGHQFGNWAGQLGDGRAITLGEWIDGKGNSYDLQLKGAGPTAYSRRADGRAVLRSSVREYLMSEAMHYLGIPTTRALSLVATGENIMRDMFYDGNPEFEPGAVVMRVAPTFLRFGNFEILAAREEIDHLQKLTDWTISKFYPHITGENKIIDWFTEVSQRTATLMVEWMRVGFVHGVMNTDNMSILGLTIDYGPYSFVDNFDPSFTPNTTDLPGRRYAFGRQAAIAQWNLSCLAGAVAPLLSDTGDLIKAVQNFSADFNSKYYAMMGNKLGLDEIKEGDVELIGKVEKMLSVMQPDMTIFYQQLMQLLVVDGDAKNIVEHFANSFYSEPSATDKETLQEVITAYNNRIQFNTISRQESIEKMRKANPRFILRNYLLQQAIEELENGKADLFTELQQAIKEPYSNKWDQFFAKRPEWAVNKAGCSMLSCSS